MALDLDKTVTGKFSEKADRKAYDYSKMPPDVIKQIQEKQDQSETLQAQKIEEQKRRYPSEKATALNAALLKHPRDNFDPPILIKVNIEEKVEKDLRQIYADEVKEIRETHEAEVNKIVMEYEKAHPEIEKDRVAIEKMREQKRHDREVTRIREQDTPNREGRNR